jgi:hypothetical protein
MASIWENGWQVEWKHFDTYLDFMLYCEDAQAQTQVEMSVHLVDTCFMFLTYILSPSVSEQLARAGGLNADESAQSGGRSEILDFSLSSCDAAKAAEETFISKMSGKGGSHRFKECKKVLGATEITVLSDLAQWRKQVHFLHANAFAQYYLLDPAWADLRGFRGGAVMAALFECVQSNQC